MMFTFRLIREARKCGRIWPLLMACTLASIATAQAPGVTDSEIKIGSCTVLDGPNRQYGLQSVLGGTAYFSYVNAHGGVNGRKLSLIPFDDGYDPEQTSACFAKLKRENVFASGFFVGSANAEKYVPMAEAEHMPAVGFYPGSPFIYQPVKHEIFNVRASYADETRELVESLWKSGSHRIGVIYQDDGFGKAILDDVKQGLAKHHGAPAGVGSYTRNTLEVKRAIELVRAANPDAVIIASTYAAAAQIVKQAHGQDWRPLFLGGSYLGTEAFVAAAGEDAEGVVITQIVPSYDDISLPTVKLYRECLVTYMSGTQPNYVSLLAFVNATVIVEGLKRAGENPTREKFITAIESMNGVDIGLGPEAHLEFSPHRHKGLDRVYPTIVRGGKPKELSWADVLAKK
jgi:branched-chain amino acid transport system substrate-binding protein